MTFRPTISQNSDMSNWSQVNDMVRQLNNEQITKVFKQNGGNSVITGKLPYANSYGTLIYDDTNKARILIGTFNGNVGIWVSKKGIDVISELSA